MMNRLKRNALVMMITVGMVATLAGCGNSNATTQNEPETTPEATVEATPTEEATTEPAAEVTTEETTTAEETTLTPGTYPDGSSPEFSDTRIKLTIDGQEVIIRMYDNTAADAFLQRLPLTDLHFSDLSGIEKPVDRPEEAYSLGDETPGYDPVTGDMVIYRPWGNFTIFYGDFRHSDELVPLGQVESGLDIIEAHTDDFTGSIEVMQ